MTGKDSQTAFTAAESKEDTVSAVTVWANKHPWGSVEYVFKTREEAEEHAAANPCRIHHAGGRETTEFYLVEETTVPKIVYCKTCKDAGRKTIVTAEDPVKYPYCKGCFYTGQAMEHIMAATILRIAKAIPGTEPQVHHTGGGCFLLAVPAPGSEDTYYGMTGDDFECTTIGTDGVSCICRYKDVPEGTTIDGTLYEYGAQEMALIYEGYDSSMEGLTKIPLSKAISLIKKDLRKPTAKVEII